MTALVRTWATRDPVAASLMLETFPRRPNEDMSRLLNALVLGWSASGQGGIEQMEVHPLEVVGVHFGVVPVIRIRLDRRRLRR